MGDGDLLVRSFGWVQERAADSDDGLTFEGYASVFGARYAVADWDGEYDEIVEPGAFRKTLKEQASRVRLLLEHGHHPMVGRIPLGHIETLREDGHGLFVRAKLHDNWLVAPVADAIRSGAMSEMSIGFRPTREVWEDPPKRGQPRVRRLTEVALREVSTVVWGASPTTTASVRGWVDAMPALLRSATVDAVPAVVSDEVVPCARCANMSLNDTSPVTAGDAVAEGAPTVSVTRQDRRRMAALLMCVG